MESLVRIEMAGPATVSVMRRSDARGLNTIAIPGTGLVLVVKPKKEVKHEQDTRKIWGWEPSPPSLN